MSSPRALRTLATLVFVLAILEACGDAARVSENRVTTRESAIVSASAVPTSTEAPRPVPSSFTLVEACTEEGVALRQRETSLEMPSGKVITKSRHVVDGETTATSDEVAPVLKALADPSFEELMTATYTGKLAGEGSVCTLTFTSDGHARKQTWSSYDNVSVSASAGHAKLASALGHLAIKAKATSYGGPCTTDADCHVAPGPDCVCVAAGPPPGAGSLGKCVANPCKAGDKPRCETENHRCVLAPP